MLDHPYISCPDYSITVLSWHDGRLHFFTAVPPDGVALFNVFHLAYVTIFCVALWWAYRWWGRGTFRVPRRAVLDSALIAVAAIAVGGRLGEAIFYQPHYYFSQPLRLITNASGFTVHGMILGVAIAFWFWARRLKRPWLHLLDQTVLVVAFGTILGRVANFLAADLWGRESSLPWAMRFPLTGPLSRDVVATQDGGTYMLSYDAATNSRFLEPWTPDQGYEILADAPAWAWPMGSPDGVLTLAQMVVTTPRHPSQLYQAVTEGVILLVILLLVRRRAVHVGVMSAWFLVCYGSLRMFSELFRQPEPGLGFLLGLTRGQLLSLCMVAGGLLAFWWVRRTRVRVDSLATDAPGHEPQIEAAPTDSTESSTA
jgi:phosphatidylglycerol---prolipoprotein diacylglyceryl transferase